MPQVFYTKDMEQVFAVDIGSLSPSFTAFTTFADLANTIVKNAFVLAGIISFVLLVVGGFGVVAGAGGGDPKSLEQSKQKITYAVIGLIIVVTSYWIVQLIAFVTGANLGVK